MKKDGVVLLLIEVQKQRASLLGLLVPSHPPSSILALPSPFFNNPSYPLHSSFTMDVDMSLDDVSKHHSSDYKREEELSLICPSFSFPPSLPFLR